MNGAQSILRFGVVDDISLTEDNSVEIWQQDGSVIRIGQRSKPADSAYSVPVSYGWLVYTRLHSCRASLRADDGWTQDKVDKVARILDGEVVL